MKLFNELTEIQLAKYAHELRPILRRSLLKLSTEMGLTDADVQTVDLQSRKLVYEEKTNDPIDTRYWKNFRDLFVSIVILMIKVNHLGTPETLDMAIKDLYDPEISGRSISRNIYRIIKILNDNGARIDHGVLCSIGPTMIEYLPSPQTVVVGTDDYHFYTWSVVGSVSDPEFSKEDPGIYIKGTALGVGDAGGDVGNNKLEYKPIAEGELTNNVNPVSYPDDFCYIYTSHDSTSDMLSIPNGPATEDYQRWYYLNCTVNDYWHKVRDYRNKTYNWCNWKGHLEPGTYKLVCECIDVYGYANKSNNPDPTMIDDHAYYALIDSNDNVLVEVAWEDFFYTETQPFVRKESVFTVNSSIDVGVLSKMWKVRNDTLATLSWRFMIMPSDVENIEFEYETSIPGVIVSGESCWEPYSVSSDSISVKFTNLSDGEEYIKTVPIEGKLYETTMIIPLTSEISDTIKAGPVKIEILSSDSEGNHGSLSTYYMR